MPGFEGNSILGLEARLRGAFVHRADNLPRTLFVAAANKTVANTTTETSIVGTGIGSLTLPATAVEALPVTTTPFWYFGKTIRMTMMGVWSQTGASPTRTATLYYGSTALCTIALPVFATAVTGRGWSLAIIMTCRATGASGAVNCRGWITLTGDAGADSRQYELGAGTVTIDTTSSNALDLKWTWGTADASNTITATIGVIEALN